jgi:DNA-directed RNA polymerase subunit RPC12/RpoP
MITDFECPGCGKEFEMYAPRWDAKTICPHCNVKILYDFDFTWNPETGDEWDHPTLKVITDQEYEEDERYTDFNDAKKVE